MSELGSKEDINKVYSERNACVAMSIAMARRLGYRVGMKITDDYNWPIIFIDLPSGQVSWHVSRADFLAYFPNDMDEYGGVYDGHDTSKKYERLVRYVNAAIDRNEINEEVTEDREDMAKLDAYEEGIKYAVENATNDA